MFDDATFKTIWQADTKVIKKFLQDVNRGVDNGKPVYLDIYLTPDMCKN